MTGQKTSLVQFRDKIDGMGWDGMVLKELKERNIQETIQTPLMLNSQKLLHTKPIPDIPNQENTSLGTVGFRAVVSAIEDKVNPDTENSSGEEKRGNYNHFSPEIHAKIVKYASEMAIPRQSDRHFKAEIPNLKESTVWTFKQAYQKKLKEEKRKEMKQPEFSPYHTTHVAGHQHFVNWTAN